ncbi:hypothetical protein CcaCcLH18_09862 [Colletotrichum camelliae]|nr:hypothetical protein CcaCcLH18_09862 [Colletotrichum camelliae]
MQRSGAVYLPPELWEMVIGSITDCDYLPRVWLNFRRVSQAFKEITERVFSSKHLRYSRITNVCLDFFVITPKGGFVRVEDKRLMLDFDRLSDDGERAVFNEKHFTSLGNLDKRVLFNRRRYKVGDILDGFRGGWAASHKRATREDRQSHFPSHQWVDSSPLPHIFSLRRIANDTDLPGAEYDFEGLEMSFLWKLALSRLLEEEEYMRKGQLKGMATVDTLFLVPQCSRDAAGASMCYPMEPREIIKRTRIKRMGAANGKNGKPTVTDDELLLSRHFEAKEMEILAFRHGFSKAVLKDEWVMRQDEDENEQGDSPLPMSRNGDSDCCDPTGDHGCVHVYTPHAIVNKSYFFSYD